MPERTPDGHGLSHVTETRHIIDLSVYSQIAKNMSHFGLQYTKSSLASGLHPDPRKNRRDLGVKAQGSPGKKGGKERRMKGKHNYFPDCSMDRCPH